MLILKMTTMKVISLFGLKFFDKAYPIKFRYVIFLNSLRPKMYFEKQLSQFEVIKLDEGVMPKVSDKPDMDFINTVVSRLLSFFEGLTYAETRNAVIYYNDKDGVYMLSKSTRTAVQSKGIVPKNAVVHNKVPEIMLVTLDGIIEQILNYYMTHWSYVLMYYHQMRVV